MESKKPGEVTERGIASINCKIDQFPQKSDVKYMKYFQKFSLLFMAVYIILISVERVLSTTPY